MITRKQRQLLAAALVGATVLFIIGVIAERAGSDLHTSGVNVGESTDVHTESGEEAGHDEGVGAATADAEPGERVLGLNLESTPLIILAVLLSLGMIAAAFYAPARPYLLIVGLIALAFAVLDAAEVVHQSDVSRMGIALVAAGAAAGHLAAAALSARLALKPSP
jgi:hypothetical protein